MIRSGRAHGKEFRSAPILRYIRRTFPPYIQIIILVGSELIDKISVGGRDIIFYIRFILIIIDIKSYRAVYDLPLFIGIGFTGDFSGGVVQYGYFNISEFYTHRANPLLIIFDIPPQLRDEVISTVDDGFIWAIVHSLCFQCQSTGDPEGSPALEGKAVISTAHPAIGKRKIAVGKSGKVPLSEVLIKT